RLQGIHQVLCSGSIRRRPGRPSAVPGFDRTGAGPQQEDRRHSSRIPKDAGRGKDASLRGSLRRSTAFARSCPSAAAAAAQGGRPEVGGREGERGQTPGDEEESRPAECGRKKETGRRRESPSGCGSKAAKGQKAAANGSQTPGSSRSEWPGCQAARC